MPLRTVKTIFIPPGVRWTGHHLFRWMAYYEGEETNAEAQRGWGQTESEAVAALADRAGVKTA